MPARSRGGRLYAPRAVVDLAQQRRPGSVAPRSALAPIVSTRRTPPAYGAAAPRRPAHDPRPLKVDELCPRVRIFAAGRRCRPRRSAKVAISSRREWPSLDSHEFHASSSLLSLESPPPMLLVRTVDPPVIPTRHHDLFIFAIDLRKPASMRTAPGCTGQLSRPWAPSSVQPKPVL